MKKKFKNWDIVFDYANAIRDGTKIACNDLKKTIDRFFKDLKNTDYDFNPDGAEFVIRIIENSFCHQQGEMLDGTPLRGSPFILQPFHKFIIYNILGFKMKGTDVVRFHEALIYIPRKNSKTTFIAALAWALALWYRKSGSKIYITSAGLMQSLESFNFIQYNVKRMGEWDKDGGHFRIIDNNNEHSISGQLGEGSINIRALAADPDRQDSLNCNIAIADRLLSLIPVMV